MKNKIDQLSITAVALGEDLRQVCKTARAAEFGGLQIQAMGRMLDVTSLSGTGMREVRHIISSTDLRLTSLSLDFGRAGLGPAADIDAVLHRAQKVLECAAGLGVPVVCIELGPLPAPDQPAAPARPEITPDEAGLIFLPTIAKAPTFPASSDAPARPLDETFAAAVDGALIELGRFADRYRMTLALRSDLSSAAALERALRAAACPWFGVDFDPAWLLQDGWDAHEFFSRLSGQIRHVRARDALRGEGSRTRPTVLGCGDVDWPATAAHLDSAGFHGTWCVDPVELNNRAAAAFEAPKFFRELMRK